MKTYACPGCGDRYQVTADYETDCQSCGREMHVLDGVIRGGGVMAIWRDGKEVWSGTGLEAVELLQKVFAIWDVKVSNEHGGENVYKLIPRQT